MYDRYEDMRPISNQPGKMYATVKSHKLDPLENMTYMGETVRNVETIWKEYNMSSEKSNPSKRFKINIAHHFSWSVICKAAVKKFRQKILGAYFIAPTRNDKIESDLLHPFKNGIT